MPTEIDKKIFAKRIHVSFDDTKTRKQGCFLQEAIIVGSRVEQVFPILIS